jgi:hypothetical protein
VDDGASFDGLRVSARFEVEDEGVPAGDWAAAPWGEAVPEDCSLLAFFEILLLSLARESCSC